MVLSMITISCMSTPEHPSLKLIPESDYISSLEKFTDHKQIYDGLYLILDSHAALLNQAVTWPQLDHRARIYQWSDATYTEQKTKTRESLSIETQVFMSFSVPDRKHDNLHKANSVWKIFLDVGGKRYEGQASKLKSEFSELTSLYPFHNRWSTPYLIRFKVPTPDVEKQPAKMTITGPVTSTFFEFKGL